jgi:hypothetical protein
MWKKLSLLALLGLVPVFSVQLAQMKIPNDEVGHVLVVAVAFRFDCLP